MLIDDERHRRLTAIARERGISVGAVVREAIDAGLRPVDSRRRAALQRLLDAPPMPVGDPDELRAELDELRGRRG